MFIKRLIVVVVFTVFASQYASAEFTYRQQKAFKRFAAAEAHQGVAVEEDFVFAITNRAIGKYTKDTGELVDRWEATEDSSLRHMNSGVVVEGRLYCAHSTWPESPRENSVEIWDAESLEHVKRIEFPASDGALTWVDYYQGQWWGVFACYGEAEEVSRTVLVRFGDEWEIEQKWNFPAKLIEAFLPYSCSGGSWGPDGFLYVTGHDRKAIYMLSIEAESDELELIGAMGVPMPGQGIAWDRTDVDKFYGIERSKKQVVAIQVSFNELAAEQMHWLGAQKWQRDTEGPIVSLGEAGAFDDTHMFAPCVAFEEGRYRLWYCGSSGTVAERVFSVGLATSDDGREFRRVSAEPVYSFGNGKHSVLTPTLLRDSDGVVLRENGKLRMWFSATHFSGASGLHTLHEATSRDGVRWSQPSEAQLENVYAPTIIKEDEKFLMWYTDVAAEPWVFRHASSEDGKSWQVHERPVLVVDQPWEKGRLFYPTVVKADDTYLMWYGSYWKQQNQKTALGFAVSRDGLRWVKHPQNPVFRPDPTRAWESHYTTSQSVMRMPDGSWRMWYASRKAPPFVNKYFAINTARWDGE